ncbi:MAG TPA: tRNA (guanosine(46)-N7)-methyltransferase TrmB [Anaerolineales bacterium]|nr:tRNA (guanosine(46)-N7)-methyltransferase TrmB [Anaerolineales bacterium]
MLDNPVAHPTPTEMLQIQPEDWLAFLSLPDVFGTITAPSPLYIDLGSGKGRFLLATAATHPDIYYLGIERKLDRVRRTERKALRQGLMNIRLLRAEAVYTVRYLLPDDSVDLYYIFFPDPWPKRRHHKNRLFNQSEFMADLHRTLKPGGLVHFATDHLPYHAEVQANLAQDSRWQMVSPFLPSPNEQTDFELRAMEQGLEIGRTSFVKI